MADCAYCNKFIDGDGVLENGKYFCGVEHAFKARPKSTTNPGEVKLFIGVMIGLGMFIYMMIGAGHERNYPTHQQAAPAKQWNEGGNLHALTGTEWQAASDDNRLATASDFVAKLQNENKLKVKFTTVEELKALSVQLDACITKATDGPGKSQKVSEVAVLCVTIMKWM